MVLAVLWPVAATAQSSGPSPAPDTAPTPPPAVPPGRPVVDVIQVDGAIDAPVRDYLLSNLAEAEAQGHQVVIQLDSAGTLSVDGAAIAREIFEAEVPVLVWVGPAGATAQAGASNLVQAASLASVAPGAGVGPIGPDDLAHDQPPSAETIAAVESYAEARGHGTGRPEIDTQMLTAQSALDTGLIPDLGGETTPTSLFEFLEQVDGRSVPYGAEGKTWTLQTQIARAPAEGEGVLVSFHSLGVWARVLHFSASPTSIYLLLAFGLAGVAFELTQPGFGFAGIAGLLAIALGVYGIFVVPPALLGIGLVLAGTGGLMWDVRQNRIGPLSYGGLTFFAVGSFLLYPDAAPSIQIAMWLIVVMVVVAFLYYWFALTVATQARDRITTTQKALVGLSGEARSDLNPVGGAVVKGTVWRAKTVSEHIPAGTRVRVRGVSGMVLQVEAEPDDELDEDEPRPVDG